MTTQTNTIVTHPRNTIVLPIRFRSRSVARLLDSNNTGMQSAKRKPLRLAGFADQTAETTGSPHQQSAVAFCKPMLWQGRSLELMPITLTTCLATSARRRSGWSKAREHSCGRSNQATGKAIDLFAAGSKSNQTLCCAQLLRTTDFRDPVQVSLPANSAKRKVAISSIAHLPDVGSGIHSSSFSNTCHVKRHRLSGAADQKDKSAGSHNHSKPR